MSSLADNQNTQNQMSSLTIEEQIQKWHNLSFWDKIIILYNREDQPKCSKGKLEHTIYNFIVNILKNHKEMNPRPSPPNLPSNAPKELNKFKKMTIFDVINALYNLKGWEYNYRKKKQNDTPYHEKMNQQRIERYQEKLAKLLNKKSYNKFIYAAYIKLPEPKNREQELEAELWRHRIRMGLSDEPNRRSNQGYNKLKKIIEPRVINSFNVVFTETIPKNGEYTILTAFEVLDEYEKKKVDNLLHKKLLQDIPNRNWLRHIKGDWFSFPNTPLQESVKLFKMLSRDYAKNGKFYTPEELQELY